MYSLKNYPHVVKIISFSEDFVFVSDNTTGTLFECKYSDLTLLKQ